MSFCAFILVNYFSRRVTAGVNTDFTLQKAILISTGTKYEITFLNRS